MPGLPCINPKTHATVAPQVLAKGRASTRGQAGLHGDEAGRAAHEAHKAHAIQRRRRLHLHVGGRLTYRPNHKLRVPGNTRQSAPTMPRRACQWQLEHVLSHSCMCCLSVPAKRRSWQVQDLATACTCTFAMIRFPCCGARQDLSSQESALRLLHGCVKAEAPVDLPSTLQPSATGYHSLMSRARLLRRHLPAAQGMAHQQNVIIHLRSGRKSACLRSPGCGRTAALAHDLRTDFGMPTTLHSTLCFSHSCWMALAAALPPAPPNSALVSSD